MDMSVDEPDPASRLQKVKATTAGVKRSPTAGLQYLMQTHVMPHLPLWLCREMVHGALAGHTVVRTYSYILCTVHTEFFLYSRKEGGENMWVQIFTCCM